MSESGLRRGVIQADTVTGVESTTMYSLTHEGRKYPIPRAYVEMYVLVINRTLLFSIENGLVKIPDIYENQLFKKPVDRQ